MYVRRKQRCGVYGTYERYIVGFFGHPSMYDIHKPHNVALASGDVCRYVYKMNSSYLLV